MKHPVGFEVVDGRGEMNDVWAVLTNVKQLVTFPYTIFAAFATAGVFLVLQDGQVTQRGTHDQLLAMPGWYADRLADRVPRRSSAGQPRVTVTGTGLLMMSRTGDVR